MKYLRFSKKLFLTSSFFKFYFKILEFSEDYHLVPQKLVGRIIGQKGKQIQVY